MKRKKKIVIPGIGLRIIKSAIAVAICYIINLLRKDQGMVFYSQLAALWCIQMYSANTIKNALQRTTGTIVGALYGLIYLLFIPAILVNESNNFVGNMIVSCMIIIVLYTTVLLKQRQASYFSCVVFLSIVVNHARDINPYMFVWNRFLDTMIGIGVGILVNDIKLCLHPNRNTLFISGLDGLLLDKKDTLSAFSKVELNRMIENGMKFTISTMRTPASIIEPMQEVKLQLPVIAMNGAVLYDMNIHSYIKVYIISKEVSNQIVKLIESEKLNYYSNVIIDDMLVIYYKETEDEVNNELVEKLRVSPYRNYVMRPLPDDEVVVYFMILDKSDKVQNFYQKLIDEKVMDCLKVIMYESEDYQGYSYIKIYNKNATKENMIHYLKEYAEIKDSITFGTIKDQYDVYIETEDVNKVVREVRKRYEPIFK